MLKITVKNPNAKQFQLEYAMYMMLTSYFHKTKCNSKALENKLHLHYADLTDTKQIELEKKVEQVLEIKIIPGILARIYRMSKEDLAELDCQVSIRNRGDHNALVFTGEDFEFTLVCKLEGNRIKYRLSK